ncbi:RIP metalloprotease RseP [Aquimarina sp. 2201CG14-23]|uniref:RIP metalloprotease RseP n=1 Tax=Aquimarina mycalae TaxID=3040073 RepID=UPI002477F314|nr:RIP metalloprotease RseP [Aquimarina sp. 2201CG14-23]MDH7447416.1 RIP metalloprotease RseP [Aquimarina sp. 2201CG14-23]
MSPIIVKALQLLLSLSILIVLHELGHFIPAKLFKTRVEKFYLFFDVKYSLFKKKIGETVYGIGWLPLGGYVKIAGMIDESMDKEQMAGPPQPWEFRSKPAWQRLIIMLGGVTVNIVLGFLIYMAIIFTWGTSYVSAEDIPNGYEVAEIFEELGFKDGDRIMQLNGEDFKDATDINMYLFLRDVQNITVLSADGSTKTIDVPEDIGGKMFEEGVMEPFGIRLAPVLDTVLVDRPAYAAGLRKGDHILSVNDEKIEWWHEFQKAVKPNEEKEIKINYLRNGVEESISVKTDDEGTIGVRPVYYKINSDQYSFGQSISKGFDYGYWKLHDYIAQFKYVFTKKGATQIGGFAAIGNLFPPVWSWPAFWATTAFISIILAFMNILPIPALDGGHVMFLLYEIIAGKKPNDKFMEYAQLVGFVILIALLLFANGNDIYRAIFGK